MSHALDAASLDQLFRTARTYNAFTGEVSDDTLRQLYDLVKFGPTQANTTPARFVFVKSAEAKAKLGPTLSEGNYEKTMSAPVASSPWPVFLEWWLPLPLFLMLPKIWAMAFLRMARSVLAVILSSPCPSGLISSLR